MSDVSRVQQTTAPEAAKTSHNPLDEVGDAGSAARGQSGEVNSGLVQRKSNGGAAGGDLNAAVSSATAGGGGAVPHKAEMEKAFNTDFSDVRAHTGGAASQASSSLGAEAFTAGKDIAFKDASPSKGLVAHELTHVVQQRGNAGGVQHKLTLGSSDNSFEREADSVASQVTSGRPVDAGAISSAPAGIVSRAPSPLPKKFDKVWDAHPHNYQADDSQNTSSDDVNQAAGFDPAAYQNTCAIRMSVMWNKLGGEYKITKAKGLQAGLAPGRIVYSKKQDWYYILSAKEMWTYVSHHFGKPHKTFPDGKRFKDQAAFDTAYEKDILPWVKSRQGIVAFDKIFGYGGSGHVDVFNGEQLSDSGSWYPSQQIKLWVIPT